MNKNKKSSKKVLSFVILAIFMLTQIFAFEIPVQAETLNKAPITLTKTVSTTNTKVNNEITLDYTIQPGTLNVTPSTQSKEIVLVIDTSGSMSTYLGNDTRLTVAKAAANRFIDKFNTDSNVKIGLVQYSNRANKKSGLVDKNSFSILKNSISGFSADGGTNTGDGLRLAYYMLKDSSNINAKKYIVLLTDGEPTFYSYTTYDTSNLVTSNIQTGYTTNSSNDPSKGLKYAGDIATMISGNTSNINSFMIGCTLSTYGTNTLKEIASKAKGTCSFAQTAEDIDTVYSQLADQIKNELPVNSMKFQETLPVGIEVQQVPAGFTISGQTITGDLGNMSYKLVAGTNNFIASPLNFQVKVKATKAGIFPLSKDISGISNSFITYKDIDNADEKKSFGPVNVTISNPTATINLGRIVDKTNLKANDKFNLAYSIQPQNIPVEDIDSSYEKGSDIVMVIDNSGSMDEILPNSGYKTKIQVVRDTATTFINKFNKDSNINIALVKFSRKADVIKLDGSSLVFGNLGNNTQYNYLINNIKDPNVLNTDGGTNIGDSLRIAYGLLKSQGNNGRKKYVVLLTDGVPTGSTVKNNGNFVYTRGESYSNKGYIYDESVRLVDYFQGITKYEYSTDGATSGVRYISNPGDNDYNQMALNYANNISYIIKGDTATNIKPIMIAFSSDADPTKLAQIAGHAGGECKKALSETDMNSVYASIATQIQSDFTISGVQFEETFPLGINLQNAIIPEGFTKSGQKITGVLSSISYKLDSTGRFYEPLPVSGFSIQNLYGVAGANNVEAQYVLGKNQTSFISYKDINGAITKNYFPDTTISVFPSTPADISATLVLKAGQTSAYTLTVKSNTDYPNTIKSFSVGGTEKKVDLWTDIQGLVSLNSTKSYDLNQNVLTGNTSLYVNAKDAYGNIVNETVPLISVSNVELKDIEQNNKIRPGDITFATEPNATITSLKVNGQTVATDQNTAIGIYKCLGVNLKDGDNVIEVALINRFKNTSNMVLKQIVDATAPVITAYYTYSNKRIDANFNESVNLVWLECDLNNDGKILSDEKITVSTGNINKLADIQVPDNFYGKNIVVKARDLSGNIGSVVPVDNTAPQVQPDYTDIDNSNKIIDVTVDELVNLIWLECDVNKNGEILDNEKVVILNTIGTEVRNVQIPDDFFGRDITVKAKDLAGNVGNAILRDIVPPSITLTATPIIATNKAVNVIATISDASGIAVQKYAFGVQNESYFATGGTMFIGTNFAVASNGVYTVYAKDNAGNGSVKQITISNIDTIVLAPVITAPTNNTVTKDATPTITGTGEPGATVTVYDRTTVLGKATVIGDGTWTLEVSTALSEGVHRITATQSDAAGNVSPASNTVNLTIDAASPTSPLITLSTEEWTNNNVGVTITGSSAPSGIKKYQYKIGEAGTWTDYSELEITTGGQTVIYARAVSNTGVNGLESSKIVRIDKVNPEVSITKSTNEWTKNDITLTLTVSDALSGIKSVRKSDGTVITGNTYTVSQNGTYTFEVEDNAGNNTMKTVEITNIDKVAPNGSITKGTNEWTAEDMILTVTSDDKESGVKSVRIQNGNWISGDHMSYTISQSGTYVFEVQDNAGNIHTESITINNVDKSTIEAGLFVSNQFKANDSVNIVKGFNTNLAFKITNLKSENLKLEVSKASSEFIKISDIKVYASTDLKNPVKDVKVTETVTEAVTTFTIEGLPVNNANFIFVFKATGLKINPIDKPINGIIKINDFPRDEKHTINVVKLPPLQ